MAEIRWSLTSELDLQDIETYIARDSVVYAMRTVDNIISAVERLEDHPRSGRMVPEFNWDDMREVILGSYRIVYVISGETVTILRVVNAARDLMKLNLDLPP